MSAKWMLTKNTSTITPKQCFLKHVPGKTNFKSAMGKKKTLCGQLSLGNAGLNKAKQVTAGH